jgi:hypothetical protein
MTCTEYYMEVILLSSKSNSAAVFGYRKREIDRKLVLGRFWSRPPVSSLARIARSLARWERHSALRSRTASVDFFSVPQAGWCARIRDTMLRGPGVDPDLPHGGE